MPAISRRDIDLNVIQEVLGHATITMSARYSHLNKELGKVINSKT
jgi:site-specific recombinase XerD